MRIAKNRVHYLALEGGGGRGNAFPGSLFALEELGILRVKNFKQGGIEGLAGASAGAITSLFIACGYTALEILAITQIEDFNRFFDDPSDQKPIWRESVCTQERFPGPGGPVQVSGATMEDVGRRWLSESLLAIARSRPGGRVLGPLLANIIYTVESASEIPRILGPTLVSLLLWLAQHGDTPVSQEIMRQLTNHQVVFDSLVNHYGVFPGCEIRRFFDRWVDIARYRWNYSDQVQSWIERARQLYARTPHPAFALSDEFQARKAVIGLLKRAHDQAVLPPSQRATSLEGASRLGLSSNDVRRLIGDMDAVVLEHALTIEQFENESGMKIVFTGSNLSTYKSEYLNTENTRDFGLPITAAVRMSMSLPFIFKPITINTGPAHMRGVWIDGGLFNNIPLDAFDWIRDKIPIYDSHGNYNPVTLGLRLQPQAGEREDISDFASFSKQYPGAFVLGTGESRISRSYGNVDQCINLVPDPFGLLDFYPDPTRLTPVFDDAYQKTYRYFGESPASGISAPARHILAPRPVAPGEQPVLVPPIFLR